MAVVEMFLGEGEPTAGPWRVVPLTRLMRMLSPGGSRAGWAVAGPGGGRAERERQDNSRRADPAGDPGVSRGAHR